MAHGIDLYYLERARFERRLALTMTVVSLLYLGAMSLGSIPVARRVILAPLTRPLAKIVRFGYEGPDQYVRRIVLESLAGEGGETHSLAMRTVVIPETHRGGASKPTGPEHPNAYPETRRRGFGPGNSEFDMMARAVRRAGGMPVFRSEELVIERLVPPNYPEDAHQRGIEGRVALMALVDTTGRVVKVDLVGSTGERQLERAAEEAVWQCRFRPYREAGVTREVYAVFRFAFRIY